MIPYGRGGRGFGQILAFLTLIEIMVEILEIGTLEEFKGTPCSFLRSRLEENGLEKLRIAFKGKIYGFASIFCVNVC